MPTLPQPLIEMIRDRIADPARRNDAGGDVPMGSASDPSDVLNFLQGGLNGAGDAAGQAFERMQRQLQHWGQALPPMNLSMDAHGNRRASTEPAVYSLASSASEEKLAQLASRIGRPLPEDLRQLFQIADGGWGPGQAFTVGHGQGLRSVDGVIAEYDDLGRRGPGYTGEMAWPSNLVPIGDNLGTVSYDLDTGRIVQFDDYWYDHDKTIEQAFAVSHPSLADFLQEWLID